MLVINSMFVPSTWPSS